MEQSDTKTKLLDVAEKLFAEKGISATSLRNIISEAEVNLASIHYHFGSREALIREVFARRIKPLNVERLRRLEEIERATNGHEPNFEELIRAFVEPVIRVRFDEPDRVKFILKLIARLQSDSGEWREHVFDLFEEVAMRFFAAFQKSLPHLSQTDILWRFKFMLGVMHMILAQPPMHEHKFFPEPELDLESILAQVMSFLVAGFDAPSSDN